MSEKAYKPIDPEGTQDTDVRNIISSLVAYSEKTKEKIGRRIWKDQIVRYRLLSFPNEGVVLGPLGVLMKIVNDW
jgi:hypothetical protein